MGDFTECNKLIVACKSGALGNISTKGECVIANRVRQQCALSLFLFYKDWKYGYNIAMND